MMYLILVSILVMESRFSVGVPPTTPAIGDAQLVDQTRFAKFFADTVIDQIFVEPISPTAARISWKRTNDATTKILNNSATALPSQFNSSLENLIEVSVLPKNFQELMNADNCNIADLQNAAKNIDQSGLFKTYDTYSTNARSQVNRAAAIREGNSLFSQDCSEMSCSVVFTGLMAVNNYTFEIIRPLHRYDSMRGSHERPPDNLSPEATNVSTSVCDNGSTYSSAPSHKLYCVQFRSMQTFLEPGLVELGQILSEQCSIKFISNPDCLVTGKGQCGSIESILVRYSLNPSTLILPQTLGDSISINKRMSSKDFQQEIFAPIENIGSNPFGYSVLNISNLQSNSKYFYDVLVIFKIGSLYSMQRGSFWTPPAAPDWTRITTAEARNSTKINWVPPIRKGSKPITSYILEYRINSGDIVTANVTGESYTLNNSQMNDCETCEIEVRIASENSNGLGDFSKPKIFRIGNADAAFPRWLAVVLGVFAAFLVSGFLCCICRREMLMKRRRKESCLIAEKSNKNYQNIFDPISIPKDLRFLPSITSERTEIGEKLGEGNFGEVYAGLAYGLNSEDGGKALKVALKMLRQNPSYSERCEIVTEALTMRNLHHSNIVKLLGLCIEDEKFWLVLEFMESGNLSSYLKNLRPTGKMPSQVNCSNLVRIIEQIARGAAYVESQGYAHRDLALRNILVNGSNPENCEAKIADFGLTRGLYSAKDYYRMTDKSVFPIRWTAPEVFKTKVFDSKTDSWSFGIVIWEVMTLAEKPYSQFTESEVVQYVIQGGTECPPINCPTDIGLVMLECWKINSSERPSLEQMSIQFGCVDENARNNAKINNDLIWSIPYSPVLSPLHLKKEKRNINKRSNFETKSSRDCIAAPTIHNEDNMLNVDKSTMMGYTDESEILLSNNSETELNSNKPSIEVTTFVPNQSHCYIDSPDTIVLNHWTQQNVGVSAKKVEALPYNANSIDDGYCDDKSETVSNASYTDVADLIANDKHPYHGSNLSISEGGNYNSLSRSSSIQYVDANDSIVKETILDSGKSALQWHDRDWSTDVDFDSGTPDTATPLLSFCNELTETKRELSLSRSNFDGNKSGHIDVLTNAFQSDICTGGDGNDVGRVHAAVADNPLYTFVNR